MSTNPPPRVGPGRPKSNLPIRDTSVIFYVTQADAAFLNDMAQNLGFKSRSQMVNAIIERLVTGGFSGVTFCKLGWQFASLIEKCPKSSLDLFSAVRPLPPLIGDDDDPTGAEIVPFLEGIKKQAKKEQTA